MMDQFGQLMTVLGAYFSMTIGVCVWLLKAQQKERMGSEERADRRLDSMVAMLNQRIGEEHQTNEKLNDAIREQTLTLHELNTTMRTVGERLDKVEKGLDRVERHALPRTTLKRKRPAKEAGAT